MRSTRSAALAASFALLFGCRSRPAPVDAGAEIGPGTELDAVDERGEALRFRIDRVQADPLDQDGDVSLYAVSVRKRGKSDFEPYCAPDARGDALAIPVRGSWDARGDFHEGASLVTLACTSGAIAKCIRFGYKPWQSAHGRSLRDHHLACVRMVRADYCGDGVSHTVDGTQIDLWDSLGLEARDERPLQPEVFEASWSPGGAAYVNVPRWSDSVDDVIQACPERLRGRTSRDLKLSLAEVPVRFPESLLFNARFVRDEDRKR